MPARCVPYLAYRSVMSVFAFLFLLVSFRDVTVLNETYQIPPDNWRYVDSEEWHYPGLQWKEGPAVVRADFTVESGPPVRLMLMDRANLDRLKRDESTRAMRRSVMGQSGSLQVRAASPSDYVVVLDNRGSPQTATVHLRVKIDSWNSDELTPERRLAVIAISFGVFFGIVTFSAARLWRVFKS